MKISIGGGGCIYPPMSIVILRHGFMYECVGVFIRVLWLWLQIVWGNLYEEVEDE